MKRKAQVEMVGLVIIVILITLGMLFGVQFALNDSPQKKIFTRKGLSYSTMSAVMKTTVYEDGCQGQFNKLFTPQVGKDILEDCARYHNDLNGFSLYNCRNKHSCLFLQEFIDELLNETLGHWNKRYEFKSVLIQAQADEPIILFDPITNKGGCKGRERDGSGLFPIHTQSGLVQSELYLCD